MSGDLLSGQSTGRPAPGLTLNLSSNNPFRNRAASPNSLATPNSFSPPPPHSPFDDPPPAARARPVSRNPFFDPADSSQNTRRVASPASMASTQERKSATAEELFDNLILDDRPAKPASRAPPRPDGPPRPPPGRGPPRGENVPPGGRGRGGAPSHRPTRSQEEAMRARRQKEKERNGSGAGLNIFESPPKKTERRPRRNSESSIMDKPLTEEEKKAKEARRREREKRRAEGKDKKPSRRLDLIDQLDATSIYGTGLFHHDGPFDALNPHRNRKGTRNTPMQAFPKDSLNNSLGGAGPLNAKPDHKTFLGNHDEDAFLDYNKSRRGRATDYDEIPVKSSQDPAVFDPLSRGATVHGDESLGLGTSTFLEGTPAAQTDIQRREAETAQENMEIGLQRKKSLAQRIRGVGRPPRPDMSNRVPRVNPDMYGPRSGEPVSGGSGSGERNPFFNEFDREERITVKRQDTFDSTRESPPRGQALERRATTDATNALSEPSAAKPEAGGFLGRMKSLKGGRRPRPDVPQTASPTPGTAV